MYIVGFTEGWLSIFPDHSPLVVKTVVLLVLLVVSYIGAGAAMKVQYMILGTILVSLVSVFAGAELGQPERLLWGGFEAAPFWKVFAVFFPAVTGIAAGAAMSGDLKDPRRSLPVGILSAIGLALIIYIVLAVWLNQTVNREQLLGNYTVILDASRWTWIVLIALLGASLSSALGTILGAPRTLMAMGQDKVVIWNHFFARKGKDGEPRNAILVTVLLVEAALLLGDLNTIAPLLTMFFLITYGAINAAVYIEKRIGIPSYRPSFRVPGIIPLAGALWCGICMFLINPVFAAVAVVAIVLAYLALVRQGHVAPWGDVRAGVFTALAEWAIRMEALLPQSAKTWKPNVMVPVEDPRYWQHRINFLKDIVFPKGSVRLFTVMVREKGLAERIQKLTRLVFNREQSEQLNNEEESSQLETELRQLLQPLKEEGILAVGTVIESNHFLEGISIVTQALKDMPLPPNVMFLSMSDDPEKDQRLQEMISIAIREELGLILLSPHPKKAFGEQERINLWLRSGGINRHLTMLTAMQLSRNWDCPVRVLRVVDDESEMEQACRALKRIAERTRLSLNTECEILVGDFLEQVAAAPRADLNIFGMAQEMDMDTLHMLAEQTDTSCLFVRDSGMESALA
jgi:hypothetical protein